MLQIRPPLPAPFLGKDNVAVLHETEDGLAENPHRAPGAVAGVTAIYDHMDRFPRDGLLKYRRHDIAAVRRNMRDPPRLKPHRLERQQPLFRHPDQNHFLSGAPRSVEGIFFQARDHVNDPDVGDGEFGVFEFDRWKCQSHA